MRQIYSNAQSVSVWLGESDKTADSDIAMQYLATRKPFDPERPDFRKLWNVRQTKGILALCTRNYWRRIWIVQEIMHAKRATMYCGSSTVEWKKLEQLVTDLQMISKRGREKHTPLVSAVLASPGFAVANAKTAWDGNLEPLTTLLQISREHEATDIRDKVYALLGLARDGADLTVDYNMSTDDLFLEVLDHACTSWPSGDDIARRKKRLISFGKSVAEMLKASFTEFDIKSHVCAGPRERSTKQNHDLKNPDLENPLPEDPVLRKWEIIDRQ